MGRVTANNTRLRGADVLIADADSASADTLARGLRKLGANVRVASSLNEARVMETSSLPGAVIAHVDLMDEGAEGFIRAFKDARPDGRFYLMMEQGTTVTGPEPASGLVDDYLPKPVDPGELAARLTDGGDSRALQVSDPIVSTSRPYFQFRSEAMLKALANLPRIASSSQTVLILGDTGTGKEIISRAIHMMSPRSAGPFITLNCGAIPETLIEAELFGHERGAFTGAVAQRRGKFETADGGTLLLDEIGEMPLHLQVKLLRVLEEGSIYRVGGERPITVDVRVIAATRRDLKSSIAEGTFREDLYYRLSILRLQLPPLAERVADIAMLAVHFMNRAFAEIGAARPYPTLSSAAIGLLESLPWKGNVRELRNVITRVATLLPATARQVLPAHIVPHLEEPPPSSAMAAARAKTAGGKGVFVPYGTPLWEAEELIIHHALEESGGNRSEAARVLGIGLRTVRRKVNRKK